MSHSNDNHAIFMLDLSYMVEYEIIRHEHLNDIRVFINSIRMRSVHMHRDLELLLVLSGSGSVIIKNRSYPLKTDDSLLINAYDSHEILSNEEPLTVLIVQFSNHFLRDYFHAIRNTVFLNPLLRPQFPKEIYESFRNDILSLAIIYWKEDALYELRCVELFSRILQSLFTYAENEELKENEYAKRKKQNRRIDRIASYIDANYQGPLRLNEIAEAEGLTTTHLSHIITDAFGMSFQDYLKNKRLECSLRMLSDTSLTLSEIAALSGFSELKYMTKAFKETFGLSPQEYRNSPVLPAVSYQNKDAAEYIFSKEEALAFLHVL